MTRSKGIVRRWSEVDLELLRRFYADTSSEVIARAIGRPLGAVYRKANKMGLHKSPEFVASIASKAVKAPRPGRLPWWQQPNAQPPNAQPVGSFRVCSAGFLEIKYSTDPGPRGRRWMAYSRWLWEQAHGPVPSGHAVVFLPGHASTDPQAIRLEHLECVSRAELMRRNRYQELDPALAQIVHLRGQLTRAINTRTKKEAAHGQDHQ